MEKLVVKTAVKTVLIILGVFIAVFAIFNFAFPQHMATLTESIGNYELAVKYASLRYYYTKDCDDLARCFDDSVLLGNDEYVVQYGEQLINKKDYEEVCNDRNTLRTGSGYDYDHWVKGRLAVAYYNTGETEKAIEMATENDKDLNSFEYGNALMLLAARIRAERDADAAEKILKVLDVIDNNFKENPPTDKKEREYLTTVLAAMRTVKQSGNKQG